MRVLQIIFALAILGIVPATAQQPSTTNGLTIDVPVVLKDAKVVFNIDNLAFEGDMPTGLKYMRVMLEGFRKDGTDSHIVAVFHGAAGYMLLGDAAYNRARNWSSGNPYKELIAELMDKGVEIEECGNTMRGNGWRNADMLPGVKVNTGANFRIVELVQQGYVQIQP